MFLFLRSECGLQKVLTKNEQTLFPSTARCNRKRVIDKGCGSFDSDGAIRFVYESKHVVSRAVGIQG